MGDGSPGDWAALCLCGHRVDGHLHGGPCTLCTCPGLHCVRPDKNGTQPPCLGCGGVEHHLDSCPVLRKQQAEPKGADILSRDEYNHLAVELATRVGAGPGSTPSGLRRLATDVKMALRTPGLTPYIQDRAMCLATAVLSYPLDNTSRDCPSCKENGAEYERCKQQRAQVEVKCRQLETENAELRDNDMLLSKKLGQLKDADRSVRAGHPRFYKLLDLVAAMHATKNSDYAKQADSMSNFRMCEAFGVEAWRGAMVRMSDKWARLTVLATKDRPSVSDETFEDTLMDLAAYALLVRILREEAAEAARLKRELVDGAEKLK